jgi:hypothetical protein
VAALLDLHRWPMSGVMLEEEVRCQRLSCAAVVAGRRR